MNAINQIRTYLQDHPNTEASRILGRLTAALAEERDFSLADLYKLNYDAFHLAIELLKDWRLDRYYAARIPTFDVVLNQVQAEDAAAGSGVAPPVTH